MQRTVNAVVQLVDNLNKDKQGWIDSIVKGTGLDRTVATEALKNAYPDYMMHRASTKAINDMMRDLKYTSRDVNADIDKNMNYKFLTEATGKSAAALGY